MHLLTGKIDSILSYCADHHRQSARSVWIAKPSDPPFGWTTIRDLLSQISTRARDIDILAVVGRHRAAASLVLPVLREGLDPDEAQLRETLAASLESHLSHNWLLQRGLQEEWATMLSELLRGMEIFITHPSFLDDMSFDTFRTLFRVSPKALSYLTVGHDPHLNPPEADADGIVWKLAPENSRAFLFSLRCLGEAEIVTSLPNLGSCEAASLQGCTYSPSMDDYEALALGSLRKGSGLSETLLPTVWFCFEGFNFAGALRIGLDILASQPALDPTAAADLHSIVSLSAHNLMFRSQDPRLIEFLENHLGAALAIETRPARRCALLYRMAVTLGRRKKDFRTALQWADQAVSEAQDSGLSPLQSRYQEAWARNIRAYLLMRLGRRMEAMKNAETGFDLLENLEYGRAMPPSGGERRWLLDAHMTRVVLSSNLCALAKQAEDLAVIERWSRCEAQVSAKLPGTTRFTAINWIDFYRRIMRLDLALSNAITGIEGARSERDGYREYVLNVEAGDLSYRLGDAKGSFAFLKRASVLRDLSYAQDVFAPVHVQIATAAIRAGHLAEAESMLQGFLRQGDFDTDARCEIWIALGTIAALAGERLEAEGRMDRAIELAVETGERNTLLRVANAAGDLYRLFGQQEQARDAYERALEIANSEIEGAPPPAADFLRTLLGLQEAAVPSLDFASLSLKLLPEALQEWDAWWELDRFLRCMFSVFRGASMPFESRSAEEGAQFLMIAAKQRPDCKEPLDLLMAVLPNEVRQSMMAADIFS